MRIISQRYIGDGQFMLQLGGLSSETKPTDAFVATGSQFFEDDTDAVFTFSGLTWNLERNGQMKDLPVVTSTDNGKVLKVANGVWSVGEAGGGGGAEKFVVTLTQDAQTEEWTADKTVAEIVAADAAGKIVVAKYPTDITDIELPLSAAVEFEGIPYACFVGVNGMEETSIIIVGCSTDGSDTRIDVNEQPIPTSTNAPLIVTMTAGATEGHLVGDKTYKEVYDAFMAGQNCILNIPAMLGGVAVLAVGHETDYSINAYIDISASGAANDYITITMGD